jgi:hypothetical protein
MKGILKIYHPDEVLKYHIQSSYCKAIYSNKQNFLEVEIITTDELDHVDDDSLQYDFPQLALKISDFPIEEAELTDKIFDISDEEDYTEVNLYDDEDAQIYLNQVQIKNNENGDPELIWQGEIDDFYTKTDESIKFKLKCLLKQDDIVIDDEA